MPAGSRRAADAVVVPDLVGLAVPEARRVATEAGVVPASADPDGPPLAALTWPGRYVVIAQEPAPGAVLLRWDSVVVQVRRDEGGAGDREPRRPPPAVLVAREEQGRTPF
jgi:beta-lactam-binding protein with PASTA domain